MKLIHPAVGRRFKWLKGNRLVRVASGARIGFASSQQQPFLQFIQCSAVWKQFFFLFVLAFFFFLHGPLWHHTPRHSLRRREGTNSLAIMSWPFPHPPERSQMTQSENYKISHYTYSGVTEGGVGAALIGFRGKRLGEGAENESASYQTGGGPNGSFSARGRGLVSPVPLFCSRWQMC